MGVRRVMLTGGGAAVTSRVTCGATAGTHVIGRRPTRGLFIRVISAVARFKGTLAGGPRAFFTPGPGEPSTSARAHASRGPCASA